MPDTTLQAIRTKVRRLTRSPSPQQMLDATINEYINTFLLYDLPEHLRLSSLRTTLKFYTQPYVDVYDTNTVLEDDPLYDFKNRYITTDKPAYISGYEVSFSQSEGQFFSLYPFTNSIASTGSTGDGLERTFLGTLSNIPVMQNHVLFESIDDDSNGLVLTDTPFLDAITGKPTEIGTLVVPDTTDPSGVINYVTGVYAFTFPVAPGDGQVINSQTVPYQPSRPQAILFYDNKFTVRPVPDRVYPIVMEVYKQPIELLDNTSVPELDQWWQYIAYGAAKKVFDDRLDTESIQQIMPEFKQQERLVLRRTIVQQSKERTATIFTGNSGYGNGYFGFNNS